jgi:hypothetical protein
MSGELIIHRNRTNRVPLGLGYDVSGDTITSHIKATVDPAAPPLCEWDVIFLTDGTDGELVLILEEASLSAVTQRYGFMDLKRTSGGEDFSVFLEPLKVKFQGVVTA